MDLNNTFELEQYFADHFDTALFPVLADLYLQKDDLVRARQVCEIGLEHHPKNVDGLFLMAKVCLADNKLQEAEKHLKLIGKTGIAHLQAAILLAIIQESLKRSTETIRTSWENVLRIDPHYSGAIDAIKLIEISNKTQEQKAKVSKEKNAEITETPPPTLPEKGLGPLSINPRLATFTLVTVLENQGLFHQALDVLDILEQKSEDPERISRKRSEIQEHLLNPES